MTPTSPHDKFEQATSDLMRDAAKLLASADELARAADELSTASAVADALNRLDPEARDSLVRLAAWVADRPRAVDQRRAAASLELVAVRGTSAV